MPKAACSPVAAAAAGWLKAPHRVYSTVRVISLHEFCFLQLLSLCAGHLMQHAAGKLHAADRATHPCNLLFLCSIETIARIHALCILALLSADWRGMLARRVCPTSQTQRHRVPPHVSGHYRTGNMLSSIWAQVIFAAQHTPRSATIATVNKSVRADCSTMEHVLTDLTRDQPAWRLQVSS